MERRELMRWLVATAGMSALDTLIPDEISAFGSAVRRHELSGGQTGAVLTPHERRTVIAAAERIIPASETPGATDADVVSFIARMLDGWYPPENRARFVAGLRELDERTRSLRRADFVDCTEREQDAVLTALDGESAERRRAARREPNEHWFDTLKYLTVFGYCTSEVAMRKTLAAWPKPTRYDGCAPLAAKDT